MATQALGKEKGELMFEEKERKKTLTIRCCEECPMMTNEGKHKFYCFENGKKLKESTDGDWIDIPQWCPLPDAAESED